MAGLKIQTAAGGILDLLEGSENDFYITKQVHDLHNLETREADYTKTLNIPATANNLNILNLNQAVAQSTGTGEAKTQVSIEMDGVMVAPISFLLLVKTIKIGGVDALQVAILYGNFNLFDAILPGTINQMNWADLAILWEPVDVATIAKNDTGIVFPLCEWYADTYYFNSNNMLIDLNQAGFWMYALEIITRIINEAGFKLSVVNAPADFYDFALCCPIEKFIDPTIFEGDVSVRAEVERITTAFITNGATNRVEFNNVVIDITDLWQPTPDFEYLIEDPNTLTVVVTGTISYIEGHQQNAPSEIRIFHNAVQVAVSLWPDSADNVPFFMSVDINAIAGDIVYVETFADTRAPNNNSQININIGTSFGISTPDNEDRTVQPAQHIPAINKKEFLTGVLTQFNLMMVTDDITKTVFLYQFDNLLTSNQQDWSNLLDAGSDIEVNHAISGYYQESNLKYKADETLLRADGDYIKLFTNEILGLEGTIIEQPFTICDRSITTASGEGLEVCLVPLVRTASQRMTAPPAEDIFITNDVNFSIEDPDYLLEFQVGDYISVPAFLGIMKSTARRIVKKTTESSGQVSKAFEDDTEGISYSIQQREAQQFEPRVALIKNSTNGGAAVVMALTQGGWYTGNTPPDYVEVVNPNVKIANPSTTLLWSEIAENGDYKNLFNALDAPQLIKAWFNIPVALFAAVSFVRPVYISHFNAFYYINKIEQYKSASKTRVELIRISNLIPD